MKKPIVHFHGKSRYYTYGTVCGLSFNYAALEICLKRKVTCKRCKRTNAFKGKRY